MTPERWRKAQEVFLAATERESAMRSPFLDEECRGDPELRKEVESLLSSFDASPSSFLESPAIEAVPVLPPPAAAPPSLGKGAQLGPYEILASLGSGGMGEVYRARDPRLGREVAIKVLLAEWSSDASRVKRLEQEARSASALNHPNIVTIYDTGISEGVAWIAMERVEGSTLREQLSGAMASKKLLAVAAQVAEGLAKAHEAGIVHRDLKPENVMVTRDGLVKILDFGLAKLTSTASGSGETSKLPTMTGTTPGVVVGTVGYMSPEQASGERIDFRSDQFSFGSILYEMATGKRAFQKKTAIDTLGAILNDEPEPIASLNPRTPTQLRWIAERCLAKDPRQRYFSTDDLARDLAKLRDHLAEATSGAAAPRTSTKRRLLRPVLLGAVVVLLAGVGILRLTKPKTPSKPPLTVRQLTSNSVENPVTGGSISPDGKYLLYLDRKGVHIELLETGETQSVPEPESLNERGMAWELGPWFPNSTRFLMNAHPPGEFRSASRGTSIWAYSVLGGAPRKLREEAAANAISPDGSSIAFSTNPGEFGDREIWLMDLAGERARKLYEAEPGKGASGLYWFRDGQRVAYISTDRSGDTIVSRELKGGPVSTLFQASEMKQLNDLTWLPDGRLIHSVPEPDRLHESNYWEMALDLHTGKRLGGAKRLTNWVGTEQYGSTSTADGRLLAFVRQTLHFTGYLADLADGGTRIEKPRHFTLTSSEDFPADWTADSAAVIILSNRTGQFGIYRQLLNQESAELIVTGKAGFGNPRVSPDGNWILYRRDEDESGMDIMRIPIGGGAAHMIFKARPYSLILRARSPATLCAIAEPAADRKQLVVSAFDMMKGRGQELTRFAIDPASDFWNMDLSPDGARLAALRSPQEPIFILSLQGQPTQEIRPKGLHELLSVAWAADGKGLFAFNGPSGKAELFYVDLLGNSKSLWKGNGDAGGSGPLPSPDGRHLALLDSATESNIWLMENP